MLFFWGGNSKSIFLFSCCFHSPELHWASVRLLFPTLHQETKHWPCTLMCAYLQHASSKEKKNCLPELFFPPQCVEFKSAGHSKKKSPQPAGGGARFLISLPPHRLTPRDSCFPRTHSLCRSLSYSRRFCSHSSSLARSFTLFQVSHRSSFCVAVWFCSHSVVWCVSHFLLPRLIFSLSVLLQFFPLSAQLSHINLHSQRLWNMDEIRYLKVKKNPFDLSAVNSCGLANVAK